MNVELAVAQVVALRRTADDLQTLLNQLTKAGSPDPADKSQAARLFGYLLSTVILRSLATELMLKVLSVKVSGKYRKDSKGHDLLVLFGDLDNDTRTLISNRSRSHGIAPLDQILDNHRGDFIEARYIMESSAWHVDMLDLDKALTILTEVYNHSDFARICASKSGST